MRSKPVYDEKFISCGSWLIIPLVLSLLPGQIGCSLDDTPLFGVAPQDETRLPPPDQAPIFEDPLFNDPSGKKELFGSSLALGHFFRLNNSSQDLELAVGIPGANKQKGAVVIFQKDPAGNETPVYITPEMFPLNNSKGRFGYAIASGDFDADGIDDLAIGVPYHGDAGAVVVYYGDHVKRTVLPGPGANGEKRRFGSSLAAANFLGSSADELVIGEPGIENGDTPGNVWIIQGVIGGPMSMNNPGNIQIEDPEQQEDSLFGFSLAVGNFVSRLNASNTHVAPDLAIGAPKLDQGNISDVGRVWVYRTDPPDSFLQAVILNPDQNWANYTKQFGYSLSRGNYNDDSNNGGEKDDLAIGAPYSFIPEDDGLGGTFEAPPSGDPLNPEAGLVFIAPHGPDSISTPLKVLSQKRMGLTEDSDHFGWALASGDFNLDGLEDLVIGSPNERMADPALGVDDPETRQAGAIYFRFGTNGEWNFGGGIPQIPRACFDYIDNVRNPDFSRKGDHFGAVLLSGFYSDDAGIDLIVGAPETDVLTEEGDTLKNAGSLWVGFNRNTTPGTFEGLFLGEFRDDACGGEDSAEITLDIHHREDSFCGGLTVDRDLCFTVDDVDITVAQFSLTVASTSNDDSLHLQYDVLDENGDKVGTLDVQVELLNGNQDLSLDLNFESNDGEITRSLEDVLLERQ